MVRLSSSQRRALGGTLRELANYGAAAIVFGQFVGDATVSWPRLGLGAAVWVCLVTYALVKLEGE